MLKKSVVIKRKNIKLPKTDYKSIILFALFLCGVIIGITAIKTGGDSYLKGLETFIDSYCASRSKATLFKCFCGSLMICLAAPLTSFLLGLCAVGGPFIFAVPAVTGTVLGTVIGYFYQINSLQGLFYSALVIVPAAAVITGTLVRCCGESAAMSVDILSSVMGNNKENRDNNKLKDYCIKYLIYIIPIIIAAALNAGGFKLFSGLFSFI